MAVERAEVWTSSPDFEQTKKKTTPRLEIIKMGRNVLRNIAEPYGLAPEDIADWQTRGSRLSHRKKIIRAYMIAAYGAPAEIRPTPEENAIILGLSRHSTASHGREARILWRLARGLPICKYNPVPQNKV